MQEEEVLGKAYDSRLMRRLITYLRPYKGYVVLALVLILFESSLEVTFPWLTKIAIDQYIKAANIAGLATIAVIYIVLLLVRFVCASAETYVLQNTGQKIMYDMRMQVFRHLHTLAPSFYDKNPVCRLITRVVTDVDVLNELFSAGILSIFGDIFTLSGIMVAILVLNWELGLVTLSVVPLIFLTTAIFRRKARDSYRRVRIAIAKINAFLQEHITGMSVVQLYNRERKSFDKFDAINNEHLVANKDGIVAYAWFYPAVELLSSVAVALIIWYGGGKVMTGSLSLGSLFAFIQYSRRFFQPIQDMSEKYNILQSAMASSERLFRFLDTPATVVNPEKPLKPPRQAPGEIEFRNVWFAYNPSSNDNWVLRDVSFHVSPGESVAIVGHTGAGKTTTTSLLTRFYDIQRGEILLDRMNTAELDLDYLRGSFAVVRQDMCLFS